MKPFCHLHARIRFALVKSAVKGFGSRCSLGMYNFDCMANSVWAMLTSDKPASCVMGPALYT